MSEHQQAGASASMLTRPRFWIVSVLGAIAVVLALVAIDVVAISGAQARPVIVRDEVTLKGTQPYAPVVYLSVSPNIRPGSDGQLHDAYSITNFTAHVGVPLKLVINNTDTVDHSITSPDAGVNITVRPGKHTYTLLVNKPGRFVWFCRFPCDPFSMSHPGYMRGYITATSAT